MAGSLVSSQRVELLDGRHLTVLEYDNHKVRIRICDSPYTIEEAFITGKAGQNSIVMLSPGEGYIPYTLVKQMAAKLAYKKGDLVVVQNGDGSTDKGVVVSPWNGHHVKVQITDGPDTGNYLVKIERLSKA
jgi:hypothetical protein